MRRVSNSSFSKAAGDEAGGIFKAMREHNQQAVEQSKQFEKAPFIQFRSCPQFAKQDVQKKSVQSGPEARNISGPLGNRVGELSFRFSISSFCQEGAGGGRSITWPL